MKKLITSAAAAAALATVAGPLAVAAQACDEVAEPGTSAMGPRGALVNARAHLKDDWSCARIQDEKFPCWDESGTAGFSVNLRDKGSLAKWQEDPELANQIAVIRKRYFITVQPFEGMAYEDFRAVKRDVARRR